MMQNDGEKSQMTKMMLRMQTGAIDDDDDQHPHKW